jgi:integrase
MKRRSWTRGNGAVREKGGVWYIRYCRNGKRREERTEAQTKHEAGDILRKRLERLDAGLYDLDTAKVKIDELYADLTRDYAVNGRHVEDLPKRWNHLSEVFGGNLARTVTTPRITEYIEQRLKEGAAKATIQNELACLRRMLRLGFTSGKVVRVPHVPCLKVENARQGFFEYEDFVKVRAALPDYLRPLVTVAYWTGWRKGELLNMEWRHVNLDTGEARLDAAMTKNKTGRVVILPPEALEALSAWRDQTRELERTTGRIITSLFHRQGEPIKDFYGAWDAACDTAGLRGRLFHDLRRSSVRNYVRQGVHERVAMMISGHKTRSIFDRYNIVSDRDLREAARRVASARNGGEMGKIEVPSDNGTATHAS